MNSSSHHHDFVAEAYASPQSVDRDPSRDFRDDVAAVSLQLAADFFRRPLAEIGLSLCVPVENPADLIAPVSLWR